MAPQNLERLVLDDDLHEALLDAHRHPFGRVPVLVVAQEDVISLLLCLLLGHPHGGDLGVAEHGVGHGRVVDGGLLPAHEVAPRDLGLVVGDVLEHVLPDGVAEGPDPRLRRLQVLVHHDVASMIQFHAGHLRLQKVSVGSPPGCQHYLLGLEVVDELRAPVPGSDHLLPALDACLNGLHVGVDVHAALHRILQ